MRTETGDGADLLTLSQQLLRGRCLGGRNWRSRTRRWRRGGRLFDRRRGGGCGFRRGRAWLLVRMVGVFWLVRRGRLVMVMGRRRKVAGD